MGSTYSAVCKSGGMGWEDLTQSEFCTKSGSWSSQNTDISAGILAVFGREGSGWGGDGRDWLKTWENWD